MKVIKISLFVLILLSCSNSKVVILSEFGLNYDDVYFSRGLDGYQLSSSDNNVYKKSIENPYFETINLKASSNRKYVKSITFSNENYIEEEPYLVSKIMEILLSSFGDYSKSETVEDDRLIRVPIIKYFWEFSHYSVIFVYYQTKQGDINLYLTYRFKPRIPIDLESIHIE